MTAETVLSRVLFVIVFAGGYLFFTHGIQHRHSIIVSTQLGRRASVDLSGE